MQSPFDQPGNVELHLALNDPTSPPPSMFDLPPMILPVPSVIGGLFAMSPIAPSWRF
jgi:hypothetical protein